MPKLTEKVHPLTSFALQALILLLELPLALSVGLEHIQVLLVQPLALNAHQELSVPLLEVHLALPALLEPTMETTVLPNVMHAPLVHSVTANTVSLHALLVNQ